ncbi:MAG: hypothetical protein AB8B85_04265 [Paracoccaceae bacterium]
MFKPLLVGALMSLTGVAVAEPVAILAHPAETIHVQGRAAQLTVFFDHDEDHYNVTMLFVENTGEVLRSRVRLVDDQTHAITLHATETDLSTQFRVERVGRYVGVHVVEMDDIPQLAQSSVGEGNSVK